MKVSDHYFTDGENSLLIETEFNRHVVLGGGIIKTTHTVTIRGDGKDLFDGTLEELVERIEEKG